MEENMKLVILAAIYAQVAVMEGMKAENMQRQQLGHSMAYTDSDFFAVNQELESLAELARSSG